MGASDHILLCQEDVMITNLDIMVFGQIFMEEHTLFNHSAISVAEIWHKDPLVVRHLFH